MPAILERYLKWEQATLPDTEVCGYYEWQVLGREYSISAFIGEPELQARFAPFGQSPDASLYCLWLQDDGKLPVVYLGSGQDARLIAKIIEDFFVLLAIGYKDLAAEYDKDVSVEGSTVNPLFLQWVKDNIQKEIPTIGMPLVIEAKETCNDVYNRIVANKCEGWV
jgi:hypothetical protein